MSELRNEDVAAFRSFVRVEPAMFRDLLAPFYALMAPNVRPM